MLQQKEHFVRCQAEEDPEIIPEDVVVMAEAEDQGDPHIDQETAMVTMTMITEQRKWSSHPTMQERHKVQHVMPSRNKQCMTLGVSASLEMT